MFDEKIQLTREQAVQLANELRHPDPEAAKRRDKFIKNLMEHPEDTVDWAGLEETMNSCKKQQDSSKPTKPDTKETPNHDTEG